MNRKTFWIGYAIGILLAIVGIFIAVIKFKKNATPAISINQITLKDLNGNDMNLKSFSGKPLVVNYWATWCVPCREEFPAFEKIKQGLGDTVNFVMISDESIEKITTFKQQNQYTFIFLQSPKDLSDYKINIRPATYFYNAQGVLITQRVGGIEAKELREIIESVEK